MSLSTTISLQGSRRAVHGCFTAHSPANNLHHTGKNTCNKFTVRVERTVNMPATLTLREPPIPPPPAEPPLTPEVAAGLRAALRQLIRLLIYLAIMRLRGYRIRREPSVRAPHPTPAAPPTPTATVLPTPAAPPTPRRHHLYIDRQHCLDMLAGINARFAAIRPQPANATPPALPPLPARAPSPAPARPASPRAARSHTDARPSLRPHPPPSSKACPSASPTRVQIVTIPKRNPPLSRRPPARPKAADAENTPRPASPKSARTPSAACG